MASDLRIRGERAPNRPWHAGRRGLRPVVRLGGDGQARRYASTRAGSVTVEFLLILPILLLVLLIVIEFGMYFANKQQVALACRVGAEATARTAGLPNGGQIPSNIIQAVSSQLASSGITYAAIFLQHNSGGSPYTLTEPSSPPAGCSAPAAPLPPASPPDHGRISVRVTVCVPMTSLAPNVLKMFGFDLTGRYTSCSTTFRYSL